MYAFLGFLFESETTLTKLLVQCSVLNDIFQKKTPGLCSLGFIIYIIHPCFQQIEQQITFCGNTYFMSNIDIRPLLGSKISFLYILSAMVIDKLESNMGGEDMYTLFNN